MADEVFGASSVPEMAYNFDPWVEPKRGKVTIPEPSTDAVTAFLRGWIESLDRARSTMTLTDEPEDETPEARDDRISANLASEELAGQVLAAERCKLLAELCQNTPDAETLGALPFRVRRAFEAYVQGKLSPEA